MDTTNWKNGVGLVGVPSGRGPLTSTKQTSAKSSASALPLKSKGPVTQESVFAMLSVFQKMDGEEGSPLREEDRQLEVPDDEDDLTDALRILLSSSRT